MRLLGVAQLAEAGDLVGNWSGVVWLLIPLALLLALVTAVALGPLGAPERSVRTERGVSRYLARHADGEQESR